MAEGEDLETVKTRVEALETENADLRAKLETAKRPSRQLELITKDDSRRARVAGLMFAGGVVSILIGIFGSGWFAVICGLGWIFGGAAVASTVPRSGGDS